MFTMRIMPKISDSPPASRNRRAPYDTPLKVWVIQNSGVTTTPGRLPAPASRQPEQTRGVAADDARLVAGLETQSLGDDVARPFVAHVEAEVAAEHHAVDADQIHEVAQRFWRVGDGVVGESSEVGAEGAPRPLARLGSYALAVLQPAEEIG